ncbi:alkaline phosphatase family protein [Mucilaginibacter robiniae]|uniref:Alkaline phosphatase family protein n=1 Tax=Mucilaginibacter robiniae TaxID=2728022 RepID=A0A7L5E0Z7_9SPHI|nr:ectonucleotide pyrophosphatase/phosphodiesterase [Mucilaginibacter robiniae]QJD94493.1 alkaline phosphatase family protein [Mucilaginibacter robiniae]
MKKATSFIALLFLLTSFQAFCQTDTAQLVIKGRINSKAQQKKPYVIMISIDGMRYDYADKYQAKHLLALRKSGVQAQSMKPAFPSITFPNHYTMVTGLLPAHNGLVSNRFYDRNFKQFYSYKGKTAAEGKWYGGTPLWVLAEQQHMLTASFYWVGSEADVKGVYPTYRYPYNEKIGIHQRINTVVKWLKMPAERRPHLITFYFPEVDHAGHEYGPETAETKRQVLFIDSAINELNKAVKTTKLPISFVVVSDHGMATIDNQNVLQIPASVDTTKFTISGEDILVELYAKNPKDASAIKGTYETIKKQKTSDYNVYLRSNTPAYWHYGLKDDRYNRIGDILLEPIYPKVFKIGKGKTKPGAHGFDPIKVKQMQATFYAWGPAFKTHLTIPTFKNLDIYPMVSQVLGLKYSEKLDGSKNLAKRILKK